MGGLGAGSKKLGGEFLGSLGGGAQPRVKKVTDAKRKIVSMIFSIGPS